MIRFPAPPGADAGSRERATELRSFTETLLAGAPSNGPYCFAGPTDPGRWAIVEDGSLVLGEVSPLFREFGRSVALLLGAAAHEPLPPEPSTIAVALGVARPNGDRIALLRAAREQMSRPLVPFESLPAQAARPSLLTGGWLTDDGRIAAPFASLARLGAFRRGPALLRAAPGDLARRLLFFADAASCRPAGGDGVIRLELPLAAVATALGVRDGRVRRVRAEMQRAAAYLLAAGYAPGTAADAASLTLVRARPFSTPDSMMPGRVGDRASEHAPLGA